MSEKTVHEKIEALARRIAHVEEELGIVSQEISVPVNTENPTSVPATSVPATSVPATSVPATSAAPSTSPANSPSVAPASPEAVIPEGTQAF